MRKLSPRRRAAALCAACAAIIPSSSLLLQNSHSNPVHFAGGLVAGLAVTFSLATLIRSRRSCS